jgi:hypothetical protein
MGETGGNGQMELAGLKLPHPLLLLDPFLLFSSLLSKLKGSCAGLHLHGCTVQALVDPPPT